MKKVFTDEQIELSWVKNVDLEYLRTNKDNLYWGLILELNELKEEWIDEFILDIKSQYDPDDKPYDLWCTLTSTQNLSLEWIKKHTDIIDFSVLIKKKLSKEILCEFLDKFNWNDICEYQILDEDFIIKYANFVNWNLISKYPNLSEQFITKYADFVDWNLISKYSNLSKEFIIKFKNKLDWKCISYIYKFEQNELDLIGDFIVKKNNLLYMEIDEIITGLKLQLPNIEIVEINGSKYVIGYMDFTEQYSYICCSNSNKIVEINWSVDLIGKEFESDVWNYEIDTNGKNYGFWSTNTIKECMTYSFNTFKISKHVIKVLMPIESVKYKKIYDVYDSFNTKKIIIVEEVHYPY